MCDIQLENSPGHPHAIVNLKILLDTRLTVTFLDWIDGGLEFTDKGLVFGPSVRFGLEGLFIKKYSMFGLARLSNQLGSSSGIH